MRFSLLALLLACGHPDKATRSITNASPASSDAAVSVATGDCEPDASDAAPADVHVVEVTGGPGHPFRFADKAGKILATPFLFDNGPDYWQEGFARIVDGNGKMGFIDAHGTIVVQPTYDWVYPFCHGIARTALGGQVGYIDPKGAPAAAPADDDRPLIPEKHVD